MNKQETSDTATGPVSDLTGLLGFTNRAMAKQINITTLDDTHKFILGRPNFVTGPMCHRLRELGHDIPARMEDEQAYALHWMLGMYAEHGADWNKRANDYLQRRE